jgi:hypothetical protein
MLSLPPVTLNVGECIRQAIVHWWLWWDFNFDAREVRRSFKASCPPRGALRQGEYLLKL